MWVGHQFYPILANFLVEANELGICKALPHFDKKMAIGHSRIFLAYPTDGFAGINALCTGGIFAFFTVKEISRVVPDDHELSDWLKRFGVTKIPWSQARRTRIQKYRKTLGTFYVGCKPGLARFSADHTGDQLTIIPYVIPTRIHRFRGLKLCPKEHIYAHEFVPSEYYL